MLTVHPETSITTDDSITLLRTQIAPGGKRLLATKTWLLDENGATKLRNYDNAKTFDFSSYELTGAESLFALLEKLESMPNVCAVRGTLRDGEPTTGQRTKERLLETAHRWVALDLDSLEPDRDYDWSREDECIRAAEYVRSLLPPEVAKATAYVQWTSGHAVKPGLRARVWCWLSRATTDDELRAWIGAWPVNVDLSLCDSIQIHYTAAPIFAEGMVDPVALRHVVLPGTPRVEVPDDIDTTSVANVKAAGIFEMGLGRSGSTKGGHTVRSADPQAKFRTGRFEDRSVASVAAEVGHGEVQVCCPHSEWPHGSDEHGGTTALLHVEHGEPVSIFCFACDDGGKPGLLWQYRAPSQFVPPKGTRHIQLEPLDLAPSGHLDPKRLRLRVGGPAPVMVLATGVGSGKTEIASTASRGALAKGMPTIVVSPTRSLCEAAAARFGVPSYLRMAESGGLPIDAGLSVCTPSLHRVELHRGVGENWDLADQPYMLVLDEVEQQLRSLQPGSHLSPVQSRQAWGALVHAVRHADTVLLLDADAGKLTEALLRAAGRWDETTWVTGAPSPGRPIKGYEKRARWESAMVDAYARGERLYVVRHSVEGAEAIGAKLRAVDPNRKVAVLNRKTVGDFDLSRINGWITEYDAVIATPVLGTGISIDVPNHFDSVWACVSDGQGTAHDLAQQVGRVRKPKTPTIHLFAAKSGKKPEKWERDPVEMIKWWLSRQSETAHVTDVDFVDGDRSQGLHSGADKYLRLLALAHALDVRNGRGRASQAWVELNESRGGSYEPDQGCELTDEERAVGAEMRELREAAKLREQQAIVDAETITDEEAKAIRRRGVRNVEEARQLQRHGLEDFTGQEITLECVQWDDGGKGRRQARTYAHVMAAAEGGKAAETVKVLDQKELREGHSAAHLWHRWVTAKFMLAILAWVGIGVRELRGEAEWVLSPAHLAKVIEKLRNERVRQLLAHAGIHVAADFEERPLRLISAMLGRMGIRLKPGRRLELPDGTRFRAYVLDADSVRQVVTFSASYWTSLETRLDVQWADESDSLDVLDLDVDSGDLTPPPPPPDTEALLLEWLSEAS